MTATAKQLSAAPCIAYRRVSKEDQAGDQKASLSQQRDAVEALASRLGIALDTVFTDPGRSGGTAEGRPQFMALVRYCEQHAQPRTRPGHVLVLNDSRWGRFDNPEEATYWRVHLEKLGWRVRFAEGDSGDSSVRPMERAMHQLQASTYREAIKANAKRGARGTAAQGYWCNEAPLGYRRATVGGSRQGTVLQVGQLKTKDEHVKLVLGPESERRVIRFMFETYEPGGVSLGDLCRTLKAKWPGLRKWSRPVIRQMLRNAAYAGDVVWMVRSNGPRDGEPVHKRDAHPALVARALWERVQVRLVSNQKETRPTAGGYPLRNLLTCSECGAPYTGSGGPKGPATEPDRFRFYREKETGTPCGHRLGTLQKRIVEPLVVAEVAKVASSPQVQRLIATELDRVLSTDGETAGRKALDAERAQLIAKRKRVVDAIADGVMSADDAKAKLDELKMAIESLATQSERLHFNKANRKALAGERDQLIALARDFAAQAEKASGSALRELLIPWLAGATVDKEQRKVTLRIWQVPFTRLSSLPGQTRRVGKEMVRVVRLPGVTRKYARRVV